MSVRRNHSGLCKAIAMPRSGEEWDAPEVLNMGRVRMIQVGPNLLPRLCVVNGVDGRCKETLIFCAARRPVRFRRGLPFHWALHTRSW